jgi:hypothetical protein
MKKNLMKKVLALGFSFSLVMSGTTFGAAEGDLAGETDVELGILNMHVPTANELKTFVNPLELKDVGSQIRTGEWVFVNKSDVNVRLNLDLALEVDEDANLSVFTDKTKVNDNDGQGDEDITAKQIYVEAVPAKTITLDSTDTAKLKLKASPSASELEYVSAGVVVGDETATSPASILFYLKGTTYDDGAAFDSAKDSSAGIPGFAVLRLKGVVNPYCTTYAANDFKVSIVYKAKGVKEGIYNAFTTDAAKGLNVKSTKDAVTTPLVQDVAPTLTSASVSRTGNTDTVLEYTSGTGSLAGTGAITSVTISGYLGSQSPNILAGTWGANYCTADSSKVTIKAATTKLSVAAGFAAGAHTVTITFANGKTATSTLTWTN